MSEIIDNFRICDVLSNELKKIIKRLYVFDDNKGYNVLFVTINDKVFGFGSNNFGVCGYGYEMVVNEPQIIPELCDKSVQHFYNGIAFALALTSDNTVYGWGDNELGQLGIHVISANKAFKPTIIESLNGLNIIQISCGSAHTLVLTSDGVVYGFGWNEFGQIGCGNELGNKISVIVELESLPKLKSIHCSFGQSFVVTDNGLVYSWGHNTWCQLGHELERNECVFEPKLIKNLSNITSICSSNTNTYFLAKDGNIYFCGEYYDKNNIQCYQLIPTLIKSSLFDNILMKFKHSLFKQTNRSLHSISQYKSCHSLATFVNNNAIYELKFGSLKKSKYNNLQEFYSREYQMTCGTIDLKANKLENKELLSITAKYVQQNEPISVEILQFHNLQ